MPTPREFLLALAAASPLGLRATRARFVVEDGTPGARKA